MSDNPNGKPTPEIDGSDADGIEIVTQQQARDNMIDYEARRAARLAEMAAEEAAASEESDDDDVETEG